MLRESGMLIHFTIIYFLSKTITLFLLLDGHTSHTKICLQALELVQINGIIHCNYQSIQHTDYNSWTLEFLGAIQNFYNQ